jgi:hypothetical protein
MDSSIGAVSVDGLKGDDLANAMMKAETKSKRRVTLSICGLGMLDETEIETIKEAAPVEIVDDDQEPPQDPLWPATDEMTIEVANAFGRLTSTKQKYGDQDNERLGYMRKAVSKSLEAAETQEEQDKYQNKLNDIEIILDWRKQHA